MYSFIPFLSIHPLIHQPLLIHMTIHPYTQLSICPSIHPPIYPRIYPPFTEHLSIQLRTGDTEMKKT